MRTTPYTKIGIKRKKCIRCGEQAHASWHICADNNETRPICRECDVVLNRMVMEWAGIPEWERKVAAYEKTVEK